MTDLHIDLEISSALQGLDDLRRRQIPYALALSLTRTAQAAQSEIRGSLPERFTIRSPFVERGVRIQAATKIRPEAVVYWRGPEGNSGRRFVESLARQEVGGAKRPQDRTLAIPLAVRRRGSGKISKAQRPGSLLKKPRVFIQNVGSGAAIFQRMASRKAPLRMLYYLTRKPAHINPRFEFRSTARAVAQRVWRREFGMAFAQALATRRR